MQRVIGTCSRAVRRSAAVRGRGRGGGEGVEGALALRGGGGGGEQRRLALELAAQHAHAQLFLGEHAVRMHAELGAQLVAQLVIVDNYLLLLLLLRLVVAVVVVVLALEQVVVVLFDGDLGVVQSKCETILTGLTGANPIKKPNSFLILNNRLYRIGS